MDLIIIACCKTKQAGGEKNYKQSPLKDLLSHPHFQQLMEARRKLSHFLNLPPGPDLGYEDLYHLIEFMPAYQRYKGIIYKNSNFENLYPTTSSKKVIIVSALYGILDAREFIRNYELHMDCTLHIGRKIKTWWKNHGLGSILEDIVCSEEYITIHDLLPISYRDALKPWPPECTSGNLFQYDYPGQGSGSIYRRAEDLTRLLKE